MPLPTALPSLNILDFNLMENIILEFDDFVSLSDGNKLDLLLYTELIINNAPLTYVNPNTIETCLTPNYLLFGRQLLLSSNTTLTVAANLTKETKGFWFESRCQLCAEVCSLQQ